MVGRSLALLPPAKQSVNGKKKKKSKSRAGSSEVKLKGKERGPRDHFFWGFHLGIRETKGEALGEIQRKK